MYSAVYRRSEMRNGAFFVRHENLYEISSQTPVAVQIDATYLAGAENPAGQYGVVGPTRVALPRSTAYHWHPHPSHQIFCFFPFF